MIQQYWGLLIYLFSSFNWAVFVHQEAYMLVKKKRKEKKKCYSQQGGKTWPVLTSCLPLLISPSITLFAPPHLPASLFLPWSLSFLLTLPQSYIKSYQPLEEHIKVLGPVKSYKLSALQYHYMFHPPSLSSLSPNFWSEGVYILG